MSTFNSSSGSVASQLSTGAEFRRGIAESLPVLIGFLPIALVLGAQATAKGFSLWQVPLMTGANFAGGSEFVAVGLWTVPPDLLLIAAMTLLVNSRHLLMGAALAPLVRHLPGRKIFPALFVMCDESWAMGLADAKKRGLFSLPYYLGTSVGMWVTWVFFTAAGALFGPLIGDLSAFGFDMAFTAVFLVLLRGAWTSFKAVRPWFVSLAVAAPTYLVLPGAWYVATGALSGLIAAFFLAEEK
jgi:4-azaleucine resistance transporter AzlC